MSLGCQSSRYGLKGHVAPLGVMPAGEPTQGALPSAGTPCSSPQARTLGIADGSVRSSLGALTEGREAAST